MATRNRFFEVFVLLLLTLGITTIGIMYIRERSRSHNGNSHNSSQELISRGSRFHSSDNRENDIISRLRNMYLNNETSARNRYTRIHSDRRHITRSESETETVAPSTGRRDEYLFRKAVLLYKHLRYDDVIKTVDELQLNYPQSRYRIRGRCYQGMAFLKKGRNTWKRDYVKAAQEILVEALNHYIRYRQMEPREITEFVVAVGEASRTLGGTGADIEYLLKRALVGAPAAHKPEINVQLGYISFFRRNYNEAMLYFLKSNSDLARIGMARVYIHISKPDQAFRIYDEFITYNRESEFFPDVKKAYIKQALFWGKRAYAEGNVLLAYKILTPLIQHFPDIREAEECHFIIAESLYRKRAFHYALKYYTRIAVHFQSPYYDIALYRIGQIYFEINNISEALAAFDRLVSTKPDTRYRSEIEKYRNRIQPGADIRTEPQRTPENRIQPDRRNSIRNEDENRDRPETRRPDSRGSDAIIPPAQSVPVTPPGLEDRERDMLRGMN